MMTKLHKHLKEVRKKDGSAFKTPMVSRKLKLTQTNNLFLENLNVMVGGDADATVNTALNIVRKVLDFREENEHDFYLWYVKTNLQEMSEEIIHAITSKNMTKSEMEKYITDKIWKTLIRHEWGRKSVIKRYNTIMKNNNKTN